MATASPTNAPASADTSHHAELIEEHVRRTQSYLRSSDIASAAVTILVFVLGFLITTTVVDHWIWPGGLGKAPRFLACALMLVTVSVYAWRKLIPYVFRRINPVYAADRLEHAQPTLMNSLVNLLLLKSEQRPVPAAVMRGLERQAATGIAELPAEAAIDRKRLLRVGYVLIGLVLVAALYLLFSPKSPFTSVARILLPLANIDPVTRVQIAEVQPGTKNVYRGDPVTVTAEVRNLRDDEPVTLRYSSLDAQAENQSVTMHRQEGQSLFSCQLPPDPAGMQRDLVYHIEAGDARSTQFKLHVVPAPTLQIEGIEYQYPAYTGMPSLTVERQGDIKALEGTKVAIRAKASQPIKSASIELRGPKDSTLAMQTRGEEAARVELPLKLIEVEGERQPQYTSYRLTMTNEHGDANRDPAEYRIEVTPDMPPQVDIVEPKERVVDLPLNKELPIEVRARDADFALSDVRLTAMRNDERLFDSSLSSESKVRLDQPVKVAYRLIPAQHGLKPGDEVLLRAVAIDNKMPRPNRQQTPEVRVRIVAADAPPQAENGERKTSENGSASSEPKGDPRGSNKSAQGEQGKGGEKHDSQTASGDSNKSERGAKKQNGSNGNQEEKSQDSGTSGGSDMSADKREHSQEKENPSQGKHGSEGGAGSKGSESASGGKQSDANSTEESAGSEESASASQSQERDPVDDPEAVQQIVDHIEKQQQKQKQKSQQTAQKGQQQSSDDKQMASADKQSGDNQNGSNDSKNQNSGQDKQGQQQGNQPQGSQPQSKKEEKEQKRGLKDQGNQQGSQGQGGGKQGSQQQSGENQGSGGGQQSGSSDGQQGSQTQSSQSSAGKNGQGSQQGNNASPSQGDFSGMGERSSADQQQGVAKADAQHRSGDGSQDGKQASTDRSAAQKKSDRNSKGQGTPQSDMNRSSSQTGDQTAQNQVGQNQAGQNQSGSQPANDTSAAQQRGSNKAQGQGKSTESKDQNAATAEKSNQPGNSADKPKRPDGQQPDSGDQLASNDTNQKQGGAKSSAQKQSGEGHSANQQQGDKAGGGQRQGMNPQRDPQPKTEKTPESGTGGKPQSGGPQGKQQDDGNASDGMRPKEDAQQVANKSGESADNRASGKPTNTPQDKAHASNNTPGKQQGTPSDSQSHEEDTKNPERQRPSSTGSGESGEKAGQGKQGQGQQASGAGGGSAGKNQAADDGGNVSQQSGPGDQSNRAGTQQQSDKPTGQPGQQSGNARAGRPQDAQQPPRDSQNPAGQDAANPSDGSQPMQPGQGQQGSGTTKPGQGAATSHGGLGEQAGSSGPSQSDAPLKEADDPNLAYARRATDLTLRYLQDELAKGRVDDKLRKQLGWSDEEFQSLLKRMQAMRDKGTDTRSRPEDKQAYEQWLKSLGLRPSTGAVRTGHVEARKFNDARDDAPVSVPRDLREQHEAFRRGLLEKP